VLFDIFFVFCFAVVSFVCLFVCLLVTGEKKFEDF